MSTHTHTHSRTHHRAHHDNSLADDARGLMEATAGVVNGKVEEARTRLAAALKRTSAVAANVRDKAVAGAKATDKVVRENPYKAIAVAVGVGLLIGYLKGRRKPAAAE